MPVKIRSEIDNAFGDDVQKHWLSASRDDIDPNAARRDAELEYKTLLSLQAAASRSKTRRRCEDAWNVEVHLAILKPVLTGQITDSVTCKKLPNVAAGS